MGLHPHNSEASCFGMSLARVLRARHPFHTAKLVAGDLDCTVKAAENLLAGHLSARTMTRLIHAYGWEVITEAMAETTGQSLRAYIEEQRVKSELEARIWDEKRRGYVELAARLDGRLAKGASVGRRAP